MNHQIFNREYHEARMEKAQKSLFGEFTAHLIEQVEFPKTLKPDTVYKLRITYNTQIQQYHFSVYHPRKISSLQCVVDNRVSYPHKFEDRNRIANLFAQKGEADDIIIIKNGKVTDSSYTSLAFLKDGKWYTPDTPLLPGTKRAYYLKKGKLEEMEISLNNIENFEGVCLINAFFDLSLDRLIPTDKIKKPE
ncbi:MAG: aminotransferase class IV [Bacteroidales bacterium]|nr:aminotransferase class IV [Bacteroidales bacterium]